MVLLIHIVYKRIQYKVSNQSINLLCRKYFKCITELPVPMQLRYNVDFHCCVHMISTAMSFSFFYTKLNHL